MRMVPLYRATLSVERIEVVFDDAEDINRSWSNTRETNAITIDEVTATLADPQTALAQVLAIGMEKAKLGVLTIAFDAVDNTSKLVRPPLYPDPENPEYRRALLDDEHDEADAATKLAAEYRDEFGETDAEWAARQVEKRQALRNEVPPIEQVMADLKSAKRGPGPMNAVEKAKRKPPYQSVPLIRDEDDDDEDEDYSPPIGRPIRDNPQA